MAKTKEDPIERGKRQLKLENMRYSNMSQSFIGIQKPLQPHKTLAQFKFRIFRSVIFVLFVVVLLVDWIM